MYLLVNHCLEIQNTCYQFCRKPEQRTEWNSFQIHKCVSHHFPMLVKVEEEIRVHCDLK